MKNLDSRGNQGAPYKNNLSSVLNKQVRASQNYQKSYDPSLASYTNQNTASMPLSPSLDDKHSRYSRENGAAAIRGSNKSNVGNRAGENLER